MIDKSVIKTLRRYTETSFVERHIKIPYLKHGEEETIELINRIMRFARLLPGYLDTAGKVMLMYQIVTDTVTYEYDETNENRYSYLEALENKKAVCMGIAELFHVLCIACGAKSKIVVGYCTNSKGESDYHAWVQVYLPDDNLGYQWYMADPTWDLAEKRVKWKYYMKSDEFFLNNGHYWLKEDYNQCEKDMETPERYQKDVINRVIAIFRQIVCN